MVSSFLMFRKVFLLLLILSSFIDISSATPTSITGCGNLTTEGVYILSQNISNSSTCLTIESNNIIVDGNGYNITFSTSSTGYGIFVNGYGNVSVQNISINQQNKSVTGAYGIYYLTSNYGNITSTYINLSSPGGVGIILSNSTHDNISNNYLVNVGVVISADSDYNTIANDQVYATAYGLYIASSRFNTVRDNIIETWLGTNHSVYLYRANVTSLENNSILAHGSLSNGIRVVESTNDSISNGSIISLAANSYFLEGSSDIYFTNTNFTISRGIYFQDNSIFKYTENNIEIDTSVSCYPCFIARRIDNVESDFVNITDANYTAGTNITYRLHGLTDYSYKIYKDTVNLYNLSAYANNTLPEFMINISASSSIRAVSEITGIHVISQKHNMTIKWNTTALSNSTIQYGRMPSVYTTSSTLESLTTNHSITISDLYSSVSYYYSISGGKDLNARTLNNFSGASSSIIWEQLQDTTPPNRTLAQQLQIFDELNADFIFRAWWEWAVFPNTCAELIVFGQNSVNNCTTGRVSYEYLTEASNKILSQSPDTIIVSANPLQRIGSVIEYNATSSEFIYYPTTYNLSLNLTKWDVNVSQKVIQCTLAKKYAWISSSIICNESWNETQTPGYYPDPSNPDYRALALSYAKKQIDSGSKAIWYDASWFVPVRLEYSLGEDHQSTIDTIYGTKQLFLDIKDYATSEGKTVYIGSWFPSISNTDIDMDFATATFLSEEVVSGVMNDTRWDMVLDRKNATVGNDTPLFAFFDFSYDNQTPLGKFYQLSEENKSVFLRTADTFLKTKGVRLIFPVHGGGYNPPTTYNPYDSQYPNFSVYRTIYNLLTGLNYSVGSITGLSSTMGASDISWTWTDPIEVDLDYVEVWFDGAYDSNVDAGTQYFYKGSLVPYTEHSISTRTVDSDGTVNQTWVNQTVVIGIYTISGYLTYPNSSPVPDARVLLKGRPEYTTGVNGYYEFTGLTADNYSVLFKKNYFRDGVGQIALLNNITYNYTFISRVHVNTPGFSGIVTLFSIIAVIITARYRKH